MNLIHKFNTKTIAIKKNLNNTISTALKITILKNFKNYNLKFLFKCLNIILHINLTFLLIDKNVKLYILNR